MITDAEFLIVRAFDRTIVRSVDDAQRIINAKNTTLVALERRCLEFQVELEAERGRRRRAEFLLNRH